MVDRAQLYINTPDPGDANLSANVGKRRGRAPDKYGTRVDCAEGDSPPTDAGTLSRLKVISLMERVVFKRIALAMVLSLSFTAVGAAALSAHAPNNNKVRPVPEEPPKKTPPRPRPSPEQPKPTPKPSPGG